MASKEKNMHHPYPEAELRSHAPEEAPTVSFAHLDFRFDVEDPDAAAEQVYGYPRPPEEELYETGILSRVFLKC